MGAKSSNPLDSLDHLACGPEAEDDRVCRCRTAVRRAYGSLVCNGVDRERAMGAALRVYRYHHPEACPVIAQVTVERWVHQGPLH